IRELQVKASVVAEAHLGHGPCGIDKECRVGHTNPARLIAGVRAADTLVNAAKEPATPRVIVHAAGVVPARDAVGAAPAAGRTAAAAQEQTTAASAATCRYDVAIGDGCAARPEHTRHRLDRQLAGLTGGRRAICLGR